MDFVPPEVPFCFPLPETTIRAIAKTDNELALCLGEYDTALSSHQRAKKQLAYGRQQAGYGGVNILQLEKNLSNLVVQLSESAMNLHRHLS